MLKLRFKKCTKTVLLVVLIAVTQIPPGITAIRAYFENCKARMSEVIHSTGWSDRGVSVQLKARRGCATRVNRPLDLEEIELFLEAKDGVSLRFDSLTGVLSQKRGVLILDELYRPIAWPCARRSDQLSVDLRSGEVRSPQGFYMNLLDGQMKCDS